MWDTDVCTNLIEGTPWIKHFAKHSQTGSVHLVMKILPASGTLLWLPGAPGELWGVGRKGGGPEQGGDKMPPNTGIRQGSGSLGGLQADSPPAGTARRDRIWKGWDGSKQHLLPQVRNCSPAGVSNRQVSPCPQVSAPPLASPHPSCIRRACLGGACSGEGGRHEQLCDKGPRGGGHGDLEGDSAAAWQRGSKPLEKRRRAFGQREEHVPRQ